MSQINLRPIGFVSSSRRAVVDDNWDQESVFIELDQKQFSEETLAGLSDFSHAEILFYMYQVDPAKIEKTARHPRRACPSIS